MQEILNPGRIAPRMVYTSISPVSITWINCGNYIQLSRFFMYPNTTAANFIARHVFIVSHPLQGHHQRYSSEPEIPPKADRRSTQSTMKSVRMIRHHEICIQGAHPSVPHLPEPATSNELFTDPYQSHLFQSFSMLTFSHLSHFSYHSIFDFAPWSPLQAYQASRFVWPNEWREVLKASEDDYEESKWCFQEFNLKLRVKLRVKQIQSCLHLQLEYSRCHSQAAWRPCFNTENQNKMISSRKHTCLQKVAVDDCLAKWFKLYEHAINASSAGSAVHCIQCSSWSFLARSSFSAFLPRKLNSAEASNRKMQTKMITHLNTFLKNEGFGKKTCNKIKFE